MGKEEATQNLPRGLRMFLERLMTIFLSRRHEVLQLPLIPKSPK